MNCCEPFREFVTRRHFFGRTAGGLGLAALGSLLVERAAAATTGRRDPAPHIVPRARRAIYLFQSGGPSQIDLFDHKPGLKARFGEQLPDSVRQGQRLTGMTVHQERLCITPSVYEFKQHGECGAWLSGLLPHTAQVADDLCFIRSLHTDAINHDPAITFLMTGSQQSGGRVWVPGCRTAWGVSRTISPRSW